MNGVSSKPGAVHRHKRGVQDELFKALLHRLMTGKARVGELDLSVVKVD